MLCNTITSQPHFALYHQRLRIEIVGMCVQFNPGTPNAFKNFFETGSTSRGCEVFESLCGHDHSGRPKMLFEFDGNGKCPQQAQRFAKLRRMLSS